ncbi:hypothetical protein BAE44_0017923, partial [Dichanthelium oligosanthes]
LVMGKHPDDLIGHLTSLEELDGSLEDIIDKRLATPTSNERQDIIQLIIIAKHCVQAPKDRPTMQQVYRTLTGAY